MDDVTSLAPEGGHDILLSRFYDASPEQVWSAFTDAEVLATWWAPDQCTIKTHEADIREGGSWAFSLTTADGKVFENRHLYDRLERPNIIVYHQGEDGAENAARITVSLAARGEATLVTLRIEFSSHTWREKLIPMGALRYPAQSLAHLATYLAQSSAALPATTKVN